MKNSYKKIKSGRGISPHNLMCSALMFLLLIFGTYHVSAQSPVAVNGKLHVYGTNLVNEQGVPVQLRGMSSHGLNFFTEDYNFNSLSVLANNWGIDVFRLAVYPIFPGYNNAYNGDTAFWRSYVNDLVDKCEQLGIYCIIDWHVLNPGSPNDAIVLPMAKKFWDYMSRKHAGKKHVLYEICNEPNSNTGETTTWDTVKLYANTIIPIIRKNDLNTVIIVGSSNWSSDVNIAANDPITDPSTGQLASNVMYSFHFYATSHTQNYRDKVDAALSKGLAIFMTEWGTMTSDGNGAYDWPSTDTWLNFMQTRKLSWCNWDYSDEEYALYNQTTKDFTVGLSVASSALKPGSGAALQWNNPTAEGDSIIKFINNPADGWTSTGNWKPAANISSPLNGDYFLPGTTVFLKADAVDKDGSVSSVDFYVDGVKFKTSTVAPFTVQWTPATAKDYIVTAKAKDDLGTESDMSLPVTFHVVSTMPVQTAYPNGIPATIPGTIYTFQFDNGGEMVAYHDIDRVHKGIDPITYGNNARQNEGVDVEGDGSFPQFVDVGYVITGEWLEYTVNVTTSGTYNFSLLEATPKINGGKFHLECDGNPVTPVTDAPWTENLWDYGTYDTITVPGVALKAGQHILRLYFDQGNFNVSSMIFTSTGGTVHTITPTAGTGGLISPSTPVTVADGASQTFTITPLDGYTIADVKLDGTTSLGAVTSYTIPNITRDHTISATFKTAYTIVATAGEYGSIDPSGSKTFNKGDNQTYTFTPDLGYRVGYVFVDDLFVGTNSTYTFNSISNNHTIDVVFACDYANLYAVPRGDGLPQTKVYNYKYTYILMPNEKVQFDPFHANININWDSNNKQLNQFSLDEVDAGGNGSHKYVDLTKGGSSWDFKDPSPSIKIVPSIPGDYYINVDGDNLVLVDKSGSTALYFTNSLDFPRTCNPIMQSIMASADPNGAISPSGGRKIMKGGSQIYSITPSTGYAISDIKVDGVSQGANTSYMFYNVTSNHSINAVFAPKCDYLKLYGVPRSSGLPTFNGSFSHAYVLGTGGPNLGNVNSFVASWNLSNKNLSQFSFQTNNGIPTWFLDLKPKMTNTFSAKSPSCTISGSGIPGLDGTYYVNIAGSDFVMVSKSGNFVIYGSNSTKAPAGCSPTKGAIIEEDDMNNVVDNNVGESLSMYPNPIDKNNAFNINFGRVSSNGAIISIRDLSGKLIYSDILRNNTNSLNLGDKLSSGFYIVRITNDSKQYNVKLIVK